MTLEELLATDGLGLTLLSGSELTTRRIRWAHSIEMVRPGRYLRGGELVLTVGSALLSDPDCAAFAEDVAAARATAIGLGLGDVHERVPGALLAACRRHGLPLLTVEHGFPFQFLTELIAERRTAVRVAESRLGGGPAGRLLDALAEGRPVESVLADVAAELGGRLSVVAPDGVEELSVGVPGAGAPLVVPLPGESRLVWDPPTGHDPHEGSPARTVLRELVQPLALWRRERTAAHESAEHELGRVLALVLDGIASPTALAGGLVGRDPVAAVAWDGRAAGRLRTGLPDLARARLDGRIVLFTSDVPAARRLATEHGLACGIGRTTATDDVPASVREALAALELSARRGRPVDAHELASLDALVDQLPADRLRPFVGQLVSPLAEHDRVTGSELVATLRAYLASGGAVVPVARSLFLHPNTLRHRLRRIAELTGRSPFDLRDRIAFSIALLVADRAPSSSDRRGRGPGKEG